ncbi:MAG: TlpA family protein disulfide reductase [Betaproteobacteria bacterium]|nr:MAG: TlpA family protein disulfide reductase [Betaproteobacteria bacterium]
MKVLRFAVGLSAAMLCGSRLSAQDIGLELGTTAPSAKVETLDGKPADLADYVGGGRKPALLEFWATWCPNCHELEPTMKALHAKYGAQVTFLGVAVSVNQSPERVKAYVEKHGLPWPQVFDRHGDASGAYDAPATSYVVVMDAAGKVVYTGLGGKQDLESAIHKALGK